jgi:methionyl-tRNA formyltransferase
MGSVNIHGSLLPKYRGRTPHIWAIINNEVTTGITAHFISEKCDDGDIILQTKIPILDTDSGSDILEKFKIYYPLIIDELLIKFAENNITRIVQDESKATYFGQRTSNDGQIDWNWQKERIYNWVRAQRFPYPGAFTFYEGQKITIDSVLYDDFGFKQEFKNGLILSKNPIRIKTPNGVIQIESYRECEVEIMEGKILN